MLIDLASATNYSPKQNPKIKIIIVYEDNHLLLAVKPAGIPSQEDRSGRPDMLSILKRYLVEKYQKKGDAWLGLLHRLDQPTAGLMVFAKTSKAASRLSESFRKREVDKAYYAICRGKLSDPAGEWLDKISSNKVNGRYQIDEKGKEASLSYEQIAWESELNLSLMKFHLDSGRSHQIRVQSSTRGIPLAGDRRYGRMDSFDQSLDSLALFSYELSFKHPVKDIKCQFTLPYPSDYPWSIFKR